MLTDTVNTSGTLNQADDCPWQVIIHDNVGILKVMTFGKHIGSNENTGLLFSCIFACRIVAVRRELLDNGGRIVPVACGIIYIRESALAKLLVDITCCVGELGEHHDFVIVMSFTAK